MCIVVKGKDWLHSKGSSETVTSVVSTLCDPMDCSPPGSSVPGILQARILEWVAVSFSRDRGVSRTMHGGVSAPSSGTFTHRVAFEEVSGFKNNIGF